MIKPKIKVLTIENKRDEKFLRTKTASFDFSKFNKKEITGLVRKMKDVMKESNGVGLSANQIGLDFNLFVAEIPQFNNQGIKTKQDFFAIFNSKIEKSSIKKIKMEEGCLSVPGIYGIVERPENIILAGFDKYGKKIKIKTNGLTARVFQHEVDHLSGILFIDKAIKLHSFKNKES